MSVRRRVVTLVLVAVATLAVLVAPAFVTRDALKDDPSPRTFDQIFDFLPRILTDVTFDRSRAVDSRLAGTGGVRQPVQCVPFRSAQEARWFCATLTSDGERFVAAWISDRPTAKPDRIVVADKDPETRPNPP